MNFKATFADCRANNSILIDMMHQLQKNSDHFIGPVNTAFQLYRLTANYSKKGLLLLDGRIRTDKLFYGMPKILKHRGLKMYLGKKGEKS